MANGATHEKYNFNFLKISIIFSILLLFFNYIFLYNLSIILCISPIIGALGGILTSPDSDLVGIEYTRLGRLSYIFFHSIAISNFINKIHTILWSIYIVAVPHRSIISHSLFLSTFIRILYLCTICYPFIYLIYGITISFYIQFIYNLILTYPNIFITIFISWSIQDAIHLWLDDIFIYPRKKYKTIKKGIYK